MLVYLSNAVEKHCRETGFAWNGPWHKWASYGFTQEGILFLEEYYPNAAAETYQGISGYIYHTGALPGAVKLQDIQDVYTCAEPVFPSGCEFVPDAWEALLEAETNGLIRLRRYESLSDGTRRWLKKVIPQEYANAENHPEYRWFLQSKFSDLIPG